MGEKLKLGVGRVDDAAGLAVETFGQHSVDLAHGADVMKERRDLNWANTHPIHSCGNRKYSIHH